MPATASPETLVLRAGRYLDVADGRLVSPAVLVIEDERIRAINPSATPSGAASIDLGDATLLPGLIDVHTHLLYDIEGDWVNQPVKETTADLALRGARNAKPTLMAGFTTVRDLGGSGFADVALMRAIERGFVEGPRILPAGHSLSITGGHCDVTGFAPGIVETSPHRGVADGVDEVLKAVRYQIKHGAKVIKICATAGVLSFEGPVGALQYSLEELRAAAEETHRHGLKIAAHAHGTEGIIAASQAGIDSIEHNSIMTEEAARIIKENGTFVVPNIYLNDAIDLDALPPAIRAKAEYLKPLVGESYRRALSLGLKIAFGTDAGVYPHGDNAKEFGYQVELGQTPIGAIRSATVVAGELLGLDDRGRIAEGLLADIIAVAGNPLEDVRELERVTFVMLGGEIFKNER
ncbi:MAG TPA: amidohydrolase family protein [Vicinamibacteria bacterium]|nr:amidohydrolase family protein [Vicinamibacteria bacterium]